MFWTAVEFARKVGTYPVQVTRWRRAGLLPHSALGEVDVIVALVILELRKSVQLSMDDLRSIVVAVREGYDPMEQNWLMFSDGDACIVREMDSFDVHFPPVFLALDVNECANP